MIYSIRGKLIHKSDGLAVVECGGIGYACKTSYNTLSQIEIDKEVLLYTHLAVREDDVSLYGFARKQELKCFEELISVSGVGGKAALSILSYVTPEKFALLVASGDYKALTKIKGIGTKGAQKIILELKDKVQKEIGSVTDSEIIGADSTVMSGNTNVSEALSALAVLGYSQSECFEAVSKLDNTLPAEELIKQALKSMAKKLI